MAKKRPVNASDSAETGATAETVAPCRLGLTESQRDVLRSIRAFPLRTPATQVRQALQDCGEIHELDKQRVELDALLINQATEAFVTGRPIDV